MFDTKTVLVSLSLGLLEALSFCVRRAHTEDKVGHQSKIKCQSTCENEYKLSRLNGGDCYYLVDDVIVGCRYTWLYGGKGCEKYMR